MTTISNNGTTKQKPRLDLNGYSYIMDRSTSENTCWRCIKSHSHFCHSRLHTCIITYNVIKSPTPHTCSIDGTTRELRKFDEEITFRSLNTQETPHIIITHCYKGLSDPALARLPTRDNIKRRIKTLRQEKDIIQAPNDLNFPVVPVQLTKTFRQNQFLRCDTGSGEDRILIFFTDEQINILQKTQDFLVDGTFKVVPEIFYQLYIIYSVYRNHVIPVIYALLRRKGAETYKRLITEILKFTPC
ncbi:unnamed protein product [Rotaria sp. Silwood2]|nr:unnamed protein product [Rotaria sp. Silwood2]CAF4131692.1 unnamed protein product [Rotaria sp. Silwood2]